MTTPIMPYTWHIARSSVWTLMAGSTGNAGRNTGGSLRPMSWKTDMRRMTSRSHSTRSIAWRLLITCWLVYVLHFATNTVREIYPALSLGDHFSVDVTEYLGLHPDIFAIPGRGAFINNNPGASFMGAVPYALSRPLIDQVVERVRAARQTSQQPPPEYKTI